MDEVYANVQPAKSVNPRPSTNQTGLRSSERRFHGAVVLCLGLLSVFLLAGLIGLGVHHHVSVRGSAADLATIQANLTERLQACDNQLSSLTEERDLLNFSLAQVTKRPNWLQNKTCPVGWWMLGDSCYFFSHDSGSWDKGRDDCKDRGADLVVINSLEEQMSLFTYSKEYTWIGLSDKDEEGTWKWVDGTPLTLKFWDMKQPDNGGGDPQWGEEDCAHIFTSFSWNDRSCKNLLQWICKKTA